MSAVPSYDNRERARAERERRRRRIQSPTLDAGWPSLFEYRNRTTGRYYEPHHDAEYAWVASDTPRYALCRGGEGSGKSVAGIIKDLERLKRGMRGVLVSPDLPHFKKSVWLELRDWIPWDLVVEKYRYRGDASWEPSGMFQLPFVNGALLICGGISEPRAWEGPNVHFAHFDEARRARTAAALKVLDGRVRLTGPAGEPPQLWLTTTPSKHWLYQYFGPLIRHHETNAIDDPFASFKQRSSDLVLRTADNERSTYMGFAAERGHSLESDAERAELLEGEWADVLDVRRLVPQILWWDACAEAMPVPTRSEPMVIAADAGISNDSFALVGVTRHPDPARRVDTIAVRYCQIWSPRELGHDIDFMEIQDEIIRLARAFNIIEVAYDKYQLHQMMSYLVNNGIVYTQEFSQQSAREVADKALRDGIVQRKVAHDGDRRLRAHVDNAVVRLSQNDGRLRIEKQSDGLKVDAAVALSMATARCLALNL